MNHNSRNNNDKLLKSKVFTSYQNRTEQNRTAHDFVLKFSLHMKYGTRQEKACSIPIRTTKAQIRAAHGQFDDPFCFFIRYSNYTLAVVSADSSRFMSYMT